MQALRPRERGMCVLYMCIISLIIITGPRPVNNPPENHLFESGLQQGITTIGEEDALSTLTGNTSTCSSDGRRSTELQEEKVVNGNPKKRDNRIVRGSHNKKPRLTDQIRNLKELIASSITTHEMHKKERREDREFFGQMFTMFSQTMIEVTQMMHQGTPTNHQHSTYQAQPTQFDPPIYRGSMEGDNGAAQPSCNQVFYSNTGSMPNM